MISEQERMDRIWTALFGPKPGDASGPRLPVLRDWSRLRVSTLSGAIAIAKEAINDRA